ncbi:glycosyltransferase family 4 protein [Propioniciclava soli]|uniref:glycosyltransferase family 4 protein n=1 Tax=Propioniciclava soli TaxID=2775081 RepID=UPI001E4D7AF6|nr:glycosyltransferase family 4 protein [Propioniciclava soli]
MRVAVAYDCLFPHTTGGGERQYRHFAELLAADGHDVTYLTARQWDGSVPSASFAVVPVTGRLRLYDADGVRRPAAAATFAAGLGRHLLRHRGRYDAVIVSALPVLNVFAARAALAGTRTAQVYDYLEVWPRHQWVAYNGPVLGTVAWALQRAAVRLSPLASCHSGLSAGRLRREGLRGEPIVSPGLVAVDTEVTPVPEADDPPYLVYAGRHIQDKRVDALPAALAVARREIPDLRAVILGDGPERNAVAAAIRAAGVADAVDLPGFVSEAELTRIVGHAAVLVNPSRREGYGLVVVESAGHGTPVVLVTDPGNAAVELVTDDVNGFVAASTAPEELAAAIVRAVRGGSALRARTRTWYDDALVSRRIDKAVDQIVARLDAVARPR